MENKITLSKTVTFEENEYTEIEINLDSLTGNDLIAAEREFIAMRNSAPVLELNKSYLAIVAARAAKVPVELIYALPAKDFSKITVLVQNFLLQ